MVYLHLTRRNFAKAIAVSGLSTILTTTTANAFIPSNDLPEGMSRGKVIDYADSNVAIYEVKDSAGTTTGYTLSHEDMKYTRKSLKALDHELSVVQPSGAAAPQDTLRCAIGIGSFVLLTVFPSVRIARLAYRLGRLVSKYGARTVARIFKGARGLASRTAEQEIRDIMGALTGVDALRPCFN